MNKHKRLIIVSLCISLVILFMACSPPGGSTLPPTTTTPVEPGPHSVSLINGEIQVAAKTNYAIPFSVDASMKEVTVTGTFRTVYGRPNIALYIMDDATYVKWLKGANVPLLYDSGKKSSGSVNQTITAPGSYQLIFTNWSEPDLSPSQEVSATIDLKWIY